jgi:phosphate transport system ATP-binding protein
MTDTDIKIILKDISFYYDSRPIFNDINAVFKTRNITAIVGPSGQGKSSLLTVFNRLWEEIPGARLQGQVKIKLEGHWADIHTDAYPVNRLRRKVAMVFQDPNPLPMNIYKNVAFPLKLAGEKDRTVIEDKVCDALRQAFLWDEVKDRLGADARTLSGGQQQRLCIARTLILKPEILLLDEPTASLDARACGIIEDLLLALKADCTILMVSHYMDQVRRIADSVNEMANGCLASVPK